MFVAMRNKYFLHTLTALLGFLVGGVTAYLFLEYKAQNDRFEQATARLSFHVHLLQTMREQPPNSARHLLVNLADSDVLELKALESPWRSEAARELNSRTFRQYAQIRKLLPDTLEPPAYILESDRPEYLEKSRNIQQYLEMNSTSP
jgi:hypothetical protein